MLARSCEAIFFAPSSR